MYTDDTHYAGMKQPHEIARENERTKALALSGGLVLYLCILCIYSVLDHCQKQRTIDYRIISTLQITLSSMVANAVTYQFAFNRKLRYVFANFRKNAFSWNFINRIELLFFHCACEMGATWIFRGKCWFDLAGHFALFAYQVITKFI